MPFIQTNNHHQPTRSIIKGALYRGIHGDLVMLPSTMVGNIVVHYHPINDTIGDRTVGALSWSISQLVRKPNHTLRLQPILIEYAMGGIDGKKLAMELACDIAKILTDDHVEWQDSTQLYRFAKFMREINPALYNRWGEKWQYTSEYASRTMPHIKPHQLPTYTVTTRYKPEDTAYYGWGRFSGEWDKAVLVLESEVGKWRYHQVSR